eukprot:TRINITY_DN98305_c0_g1_i1.p1 TRINITY_DN98305_c0_g1~~TRINITY_DN98305_c0_g1_i1.p1  ORF type:complete len:341 (+),score=29.24 TRINITY_DN98305_c0_g1_i1:2-1024(+)
MPLSLALSFKVFNQIKDFQPDIIHCSSPGLMVMTSKLYSWMLKVPLVLSYHTHIPKYLPNYRIAFLAPLLWLFLKFLHFSAHLTLATSTILKDELIKAKAVQDKHTQVWQRGVDTDIFNPKYKSQEMRERLTDGNPTAPVMLHVGRLGHEKNLKFIKLILDRIPHLRLAFVGDGPARLELEEHFSGTNTVFLGMCHGEVLSSAYASADFFIMPSESETLGFVVLEAMASEVPVVAVRAGGIPDIITQHQTNGYLYSKGNVDEATSYVEQLLGDENLRQRVAKAGRQEVSKWDWHASTRKLLNQQYTAAIAAAWAVQGEMLADRVQSLVQSPDLDTAYVST